MDFDKEIMKIPLISILFLLLGFEIKSEEELVEIIDPITFVFKSEYLRDEIDNIYRFENKKRKKSNLTSPIFKLRIHCLSIKNVNKVKFNEGKKFLHSIIMKSQGKFLNSWRFIRGPDKNGVYLVEPIYSSPRIESELDIENEIIKNDYARIFETCFSCAPPGIISKVKREHAKQVKYSGFSTGYYLIMDDLKDKKMKRL